MKLMSWRGRTFQAPRRAEQGAMVPTQPGEQETQKQAREDDHLP